MLKLSEGVGGVWGGLIVIKFVMIVSSMAITEYVEGD